MTPKINIKYNKFLDPIFIAYIKSLEKFRDWKEPDLEEVNSRVIEYKKIWNEVEDQVLKEMQEISNIKFKRNVIDVHIVSGNPRPFSFPIILKSGYNNEDFLSNLIEELFHVLMGEDREMFLKKWQEVKDEFKENDSVTNHILIYRMMRDVYKKIGKEWNPKFKTEDYIKAFELSK